MMITITRTEDKKRLEEVLDDLEIPVCYQYRGKGRPLRRYWIFSG